MLLFLLLLLFSYILSRYSTLKESVVRSYWLCPVLRYSSQDNKIKKHHSFVFILFNVTELGFSHLFLQRKVLSTLIPPMVTECQTQYILSVHLKPPQFLPAFNTRQCLSQPSSFYQSLISLYDTLTKEKYFSSAFWAPFPFDSTFQILLFPVGLTEKSLANHIQWCCIFYICSKVLQR